MFLDRAIRVSVCVLLLAVALPLAAAEIVQPNGSRARLRVEDVTVPVERVPAWDAASPQRLVWIDGALYQEDAGFYYRVIAERITVRLADGVADWSTLIDRAATAGFTAAPFLHELVVERRNRLGILDLRLPAGADPATWAELLHRTGLVRYAEVATHGVWAVAPPNDPQFGQQWALNNTGQTGGTAGADLGALEAWELSAGDPSIVVAVLDSGTDVDHEDLAPNVWHNAGEIPGNGQDDDGNGFVDDHEGWDFGNGNNDPRTSYFHGTHVTGVINAAGGNGLGVSGLAGGLGAPGVRGMALAVGETGPNGSVLDDAILYAADNGAQVITMSLSVGETTAINDAIAYAYGTRDVFLDCASGNNGSSVAYPARNPNVVAVASSTDDDTKSSFSNPGPEVELTAPGSSILSTQLSNQYGSSSGTSFAAPYVAALAALIRGLSPGTSAPEVRQLMIDTAVDIAAAGFDTGTGWGRIDAAAALAGLASADATVRFDAALYACDSTLTLTLTDTDLAGTGTLVLAVTSGSEPGGEAVTLTESGPATGVFGGTLPLAPGGSSGDGLLRTAHAEQLRVEYIDADDGAGGTNVTKAATAATDCAGPLIDGLDVIDVSDSSATVVWITDEPADGRVRYDTITPPAATVADGTATTQHAVTLNGLDPCTTYLFTVESTDALGNGSLSDNSGLYHTFQSYADLPGIGVVPCQRGQAELDRPTYGCTESAQVAVLDLDLDTDPGLVETVQVLLTSSTEPDGEWITLTEIDAANTRFEGSVALADGAPLTGDGLLTAATGDLVTVTYYDADDGDGVARTATATAVADCSGPAIRDIQIVAVSATRAEVQWNTAEPAGTRLDFGTTAALGSTWLDPTLKTAHRVVISPFTACDKVYFRVAGTDAFGNELVADAQGQPFEFHLRQIGGLVFHDNFETDLGWTSTGEWDRTVPQGLGSQGSDPTAAWSGATVIGNDLTGQGVFPGDYEPDAKEWIQTPAFDTLGLAQVELLYRRKLGVESDDRATIQGIDGGQIQVWQNSGAVDDAAWVEMRHDLIGLAERSGVKVRFVIDSRTPGQSYGWNLDEVVVKDATRPDYEDCGGCGGAPAFGGLDAAADDAPCAASGVRLTWQAAAAWGTGGAGTYDVYRGTTPGFTPDAGNRIVEALVQTTYLDTTAPVDTPLWYVVRARNDEACAGGVGLDDGNLVRLPALETVSQPVPGGVSLGAGPVGGAHVRLSWQPVPGAATYSVHRSATADFASSTEIGTTTETFFEDPNALPQSLSYFYRAFAVSACGAVGE